MSEEKLRNQITELELQNEKYRDQIAELELNRSDAVLDEASKLVESIIEEKEAEIFKRYLGRIEELKSHLNDVKKVTNEMTDFTKQIIETENLRVKHDIKELKEKMYNDFIFRLQSTNMKDVYESATKEVATSKVNHEIQHYLNEMKGKEITKIMFNSLIHHYNIKVGKSFAKSLCQMSVIQTQTFKECLRKINEADISGKRLLAQQLDGVELLE
jgi:hypothetical protein